MNSISPKKTMEKLETILNAFEQLAPNETFGGMTVAQFLAQVNEARNIRAEIADLEDQLANLKVRRDTIDAKSLEKAQLLVNGVIGNPDFGPDSALYEGMGYIRKSNRKSGLTRKKKNEPIG